MSQRSIVLLGVVTLIALLIALLSTAPRRASEPEEAPFLIPDLRAMVNELTAVDVIAADGEHIAVLRRGRDRWLVENRHEYEADFRQIHELLRELAAARLVEPRTALAEWYPRLGLADIGTVEAGGMLLEFPGSGLPAVILGHQDAATGGRFVRRMGEAQTWLADRPLPLPGETLGWLERSVMDIPASELEQVTIVHADGDRIRLRPADEEGDQWVLLDVPEGRDAGPRWEIRPVANGLANILLEDVRPHDGTLPEDAVRALYVTRDGLNFVATLFSDEAGRWVHFNVSAEIEAGEPEDRQEEAQRLLADAAAVDARLSPWQFGLSQRKYEVMTRRQEELLEPLRD